MHNAPTAHAERLESLIEFALPLLLLATACGEQPTEVPSSPARSVVAAGTVTIVPGGSIQDSVTKYASGTTFLIKAGVHRLQSVTPKSGMSFIGETGTVLSGARLLTTFSQVGSYWVVSGQTQEGVRTSSTKNNGKPICMARFPRCYYPEELFI